ncbi:uncharacterized protein LOC142573145 isoform X2 [Dermacentor variabilis]|uniref:uncharacterized protein LOC142573145 isoform X2 n=1 Tax=Dermacentor variabilis TaxID=34621 RepID=UPI003F5ADF95
MKIFKTVIILALSIVATKSHTEVNITSLKDLAKYQDPWKVINNTMDVYLARVSGVSMEAAKKFHCVRSTYGRYEPTNETVFRSIEFEYNNSRSVNISLQVNSTAATPVLQVALLANVSGLLPTLSTDEIELLVYQFPVGYGDRRCLILGPPSYKGEVQRSKNNGCSMWLPKNHVGKLPLCCQMIYFLLCGNTWVETYEKEYCNKMEDNNNH